MSPGNQRRSSAPSRSRVRHHLGRARLLNFLTPLRQLVLLDTTVGVLPEIRKSRSPNYSPFVCKSGAIRSRKSAAASRSALPPGETPRRCRSFDRLRRASMPSIVAVPPSSKMRRAPTLAASSAAGPPRHSKHVSLSSAMIARRAFSRACVSVAPACLDRRSIGNAAPTI
jgi:hypothetical protein